MSEAIIAEALRGARRPGQDAPFSRRFALAVFTGWQPMMGAATLDRGSFLHRKLAFWTPRLAQYALPLGEAAEAGVQPKKYLGWERVRPKEILVRPAFQEASEQTDLPLVVEQGALPKGLKGHCFFMSFAHEATNEVRFMGRPIVVRVDFDDAGGAKLTCRKIWTPQHVFKQVAANTPHRFRLLKGALWVSATAGFQGDHANGLATVDDALICTGNVASPVIIDKQTLKYVGPLGGHQDYFPAVPWAAPFPPRFCSPHPFYDENTEEFFTANYGFGFVRLATWKVGEPRFRSFLLVDQSGKPHNLRTSSHQIMVTRDYVIVFNNDGHLLDMPNPFAQDSFAIIAPRAAMTGNGGTIKSWRVDLPMTGQHMCAQYDSPDGVVTLKTAGTVAFAPDLSAILPNDTAKATGQYYSDQYWGAGPASQADIGHMGRYTIDAKTGKLTGFKKAFDPKLTWDAQYAGTKAGQGLRQPKDGPGQWDRFYATFLGFKKSSVTTRMHDIFQTTKYTQYTWDELPDEPVPGALVAVDTATWEIADAFSFPQDHQPGHACNVPDAEGRIWFLVPVQSEEADRFYVLDASDLKAGPVAVLRSPARLNMLQHSTWAPDLTTTRAKFPVDFEQEFLPDGIVPSVAQIIREQVLPRVREQA